MIAKAALSLVFLLVLSGFPKMPGAIRGMLSLKLSSPFRGSGFVSGSRPQLGGSSSKHEHTDPFPADYRRAGV